RTRPPRGDRPVDPGLRQRYHRPSETSSRRRSHGAETERKDRSDGARERAMVKALHELKTADYRVDAFDVARIRRDFPILHQRVHGKPLVYLDNAATTQKPQAVIDAVGRYYSTDNANVHRGVHLLSQRATDAYEGARVTVQNFINAAESCEVIYVRGTTEAINLVAQTYGRKSVGAGDEIVITAMDHHSNIVPWQMLCDEKGAKLRVAPINDAGE